MANYITYIVQYICACMCIVHVHVCIHIVHVCIRIVHVCMRTFQNPTLFYGVVGIDRELSIILNLPQQYSTVYFIVIIESPHVDTLGSISRGCPVYRGVEGI